MHRNSGGGFLMLKQACSVLAAFLFVAILHTGAYAQFTGGQVTGTVLDVNGAVVPNATVTLKNKATGQELTTQSTEAGSYHFPNVPVGEYVATVEASGFGTLNQELRVVLSQETSLDLTLTAGNVSGGVVEVTAAGEALVQTDSSQLARTFETRQVQDLPIFGDERYLALLSPNVIAHGAGIVGDGGSVGGVRPRANSFNVDGVDNNNPTTTGRGLGVIQDAIQQVSILTNNYNAEFGTGAGGVFNTVTLSGTNEYHGRAFLYAQSHHLNANSTSEESAIRSGTIGGQPRARNQRYGAQFGGPIKKDKLFFFGSFQRIHDVSDVSGTGYLAPTAAGLAQISGLGASAYVVDFLENNLALAQTSSQNFTVLGTSVPFGQVNVITPTNSNQNQFQVNIDHSPNTRDQFRYRYSFSRSKTTEPGYGNVRFANRLNLNDHLFSANWIRTFTPSIVNDLRLSYRRNLDDRPLVDSTLSAIPTIFVSDTGMSIGPSDALPQGGNLNSYQVYDTVTYVRGAHTFKLGGEMRRLIHTSIFLPFGRGVYTYDTFDELIQDLRPSPVNNALRGAGSENWAGNQWKWYGFIQDDWKFSPSLTFNLGVRYEYLTLPRDAALQALNSISSVSGIIDFREPRTDKNNFAPRVGVAWAPDFKSGWGNRIFGERGQSAVRANFSMSYAEIFHNLYTNAMPPQYQQELTGASASATNFLQTGGIPQVMSLPTTAAAARLATDNYIPDVTSPYVMSWGLSYQREVARNTSLELRYLGTRGKHFPLQLRLNSAQPDVSVQRIPTFFSAPTAAQVAALPTRATLEASSTTLGVNPYPQFGGFLTTFSPVGNTQYDGGSVSLTRRFHQGLAFTSAYTFSKTIDYGTNELFSSRVNPRRVQNTFNIRDERALSALDVPHRFVGTVNYDLPFFRSHENKWVKNIAGGWRIASIFQAQSGQLITPQSGVDTNQDTDTAGDRTIFNPSGVPGTGSGIYAINAAGTRIQAAGVDVLNSPTTVGYVAINPNAQYIRAGELALPTAGRNTLRTNGFNRTDAMIAKKFVFGEERYGFEVGAEVWNLFNQRIRTIGDFGSSEFSRQNFDDEAGIGALNSAFANVNSALFNNYSTGDFSGRTIMLRMKFDF
jgi:hypothetical protein